MEVAWVQIPGLLLRSWVRLEKLLYLLNILSPQLLTGWCERVDHSALKLAQSKPGALWVAPLTITFSSKPVLCRSYVELLIEKSKNDIRVDVFTVCLG